eukprot:5236456-Amphidinium_carterae.1
MEPFVSMLHSVFKGTAPYREALNLHGGGVPCFSRAVRLWCPLALSIVSTRVYDDIVISGAYAKAVGN